MTTFRPIGAKLLVVPVPTEEKIGLIVVPQKSRKRESRATVVSLGPGMLCKDGTRWSMPAVEPGDLIAHSQGAGTEIWLDGIEHRVLRDDDVLAVLEA